MLFLYEYNPLEVTFLMKQKEVLRARKLYTFLFILELSSLEKTNTSELPETAFSK